MGHGPTSFKETDLKRALRAIEAAGQKATIVEIEPGRITIKIKNGSDADDNSDNTETADDLRKLI